MRAPSYLSFKKANYPWKSGIDYRVRPSRYRVGKGEQGVFICEPYKGSSDANTSSMGTGRNPNKKSATPRRRKSGKVGTDESARSANLLLP